MSAIATLGANQNILFYSISDKSLLRQLIGFNDEVIDATFLSSDPATKDSFVALATNSSLIRVYSIQSLDARLVEGHTDMVLCVDRVMNGRVLASGSKDRTARLWVVADDGSWRCTVICEGHAESVGALVFARQYRPQETEVKFMFTGSQDRTIKMWDLSNANLLGQNDDPIKPKSLLTLKAHEKDINSLDISPNNRLLVSGSQDKTAKVFGIEYVNAASGNRGKLKHLGTLQGHKRGIWSVKFSQSDRYIATASGDKTIKLWNIDDYSCLKVYFNVLSTMPMTNEVSS
jgi:U3 small nucleolar RNA-associated protein 13